MNKLMFFEILSEFLRKIFNLFTSCFSLANIVDLIIVNKIELLYFYWVVPSVQIGMTIVE